MRLLTPAIPRHVISSIAQPNGNVRPGTPAGKPAEPSAVDAARQDTDPVDQTAVDEAAVDKARKELDLLFRYLRADARSEVFSSQAREDYLRLVAQLEMTVRIAGGIFDPAAAGTHVSRGSADGQIDKQLDDCKRHIADLQSFVICHSPGTRDQIMAALTALLALVIAIGAIVAIAKGNLLNPPTFGGIIVAVGAAIFADRTMTGVRRFAETTQIRCNHDAIAANLETLQSNLSAGGLPALRKPEVPSTGSGSHGFGSTDKVASTRDLRIEDNETRARKRFKDNNDRALRVDTSCKRMVKAKFERTKDEQDFDIKTQPTSVTGAGISHTMGWRSTMEDTFHSGRTSVSVNGEMIDIAVDGVFDGHSGSDAAIRAKDGFTEVLRTQIAKYNPAGISELGMYNALKLAMVELGSQIRAKTGAGTTACVSIRLCNDIYIANVGDSRAIMVAGDTVQQLSVDASPDDPVFGRGVRSRNGVVINSRVGGMLATARALGDRDLGASVSARPKITLWRAPEGGWPQHSYIVIGSDGLFDVGSTAEVATAVKTEAAKGTSPATIAERLVKTAFQAGSADNITALVMPL